jgi:predicted nuclease with TOPRIM domain
MNMKTSPNDVSNNEILEALNAFAVSVDERFDRLDGRMDGVEGKVDRLDGKVDRLEGRMDKVEGKMDRIEHRLTKVETTMVTKGYLDDKLADLKSDLMHYTDKQIEKAVR